MSVALRGPREILGSPLPVGRFAIDCISQALLAACELAEARGLPRPTASLDTAHVEAAFTSERHARIGGRAPQLFSPYSTWLRTSDGWLGSHGNYAHHRAALMHVLALDREVVQLMRAAASRRGALELEEAVFAAGGCAAALRDRAGWDDSPQGAALAGRGLMDVAPGPLGAPRLDLPRDGGQTAPVDPAPFLTHFRDVTLVNPPGELNGRPLRWRRGPEPIGASTGRTSWR